MSDSSVSASSATPATSAATNANVASEAPSSASARAGVDPEYPAAGTEPRLTARDTTASGLPAILETVRYAARHGAGRTLLSLAAANKRGGFDCPSCAWPDPEGVRHPAEFCENGAKAIAWEATSKTIGAAFFATHSVAELSQRSERWLGDQGRIAEPLVLRRGRAHYEPIAWDEAFELIGRELRALESPDEALFYTSGRASNEAAFCYQLFVRLFGTNNLPDCSNMCHESSGLGLQQAIGIGKGTVTLDDFSHADCIFVIGQNPGTNHPRMLAALEQAARRGAAIVSLNPLAETGLIRFKHPQSPIDMLGSGTPIARLFLPVRINGDVAALKGIMKAMLALDEQRAARGEPGVIDRAFLATHTHGFEAFAEDLRATGWDAIELGSGLTRAQLEEAAAIAAASERMITCWAMGITQHANGVANVQTIVNFNLLRGQIGRKGAGVCPVRGHSNVQGDRTMGIQERMTDRFREALGREFAFTPPAAPGFDTVAGLRAMHGGRVRVFVGLGGNFLSAGPDTAFGAEAFRRLRLSVQISTKLNRNHLVTGEEALILPCLGRTEQDRQAAGDQFVSCENSMGVVQSSRGVLEPISPHLMSETAIVCHLAAATLGARTQVDWRGLCADYDRIRDHIERVVPGFEDYNRRVRMPGGFHLPNPPRDAREFRTAAGKATFFVHPMPEWRLAPDQLLLMSVRSHDQFNTTIYGENDRYRGVSGGRRVIFLHPDDIRARGLAPEQWVDITSHFAGEQRHARRFLVAPYDIPRGCAAAYYPEVNPLVPIGHVAAGSGQPASKSIVITLAPADAPPEDTIGAPAAATATGTAAPRPAADSSHS